MKKIVWYSTSVIVSMVWLVLTHHTYNPISLRGPEFIKFYLILLLGFYVSVMVLKSLKQQIPKMTFYFMIFIFLLGVVKLFRGLSLDRPVGILFSILVAEIIINMIFISTEFKHKIKQ